MLMRQVMTERLAIPVKDPMTELTMLIRDLMTEVSHPGERPDD